MVINLVKGIESQSSSHQEDSDKNSPIYYTKLLKFSSLKSTKENRK